MANEVPRRFINQKPYDGFSYGGELNFAKFDVNPASEVVGLHYWTMLRFGIYGVDTENRTITVNGVELVTLMCGPASRKGKGISLKT